MLNDIISEFLISPIELILLSLTLLLLCLVFSYRWGIYSTKISPELKTKSSGLRGSFYHQGMIAIGLGFLTMMFSVIPSFALVVHDQDGLSESALLYTIPLSLFVLLLGAGIPVAVARVVSKSISKKKSMGTL